MNLRLPRCGPAALTAAAALAGSLTLASAAPPGLQANEAQEHFEKEVRPIFVEHCVECHGGEKPKGGLRLDTTAGIQAGAYGAPIVLAGDLEASALIEAVRYDDPLYAMPPTGKLPDEAIAALERWVELGADVPDDVAITERDRLRWSLRPPVPRASDVAPAPGRDWIDAAIEARLAELDIEPSAPASRASWLRRVTFDLTGLPPTPEEWRGYLATDGTRAAREEVVDRLLASPAFAERWARRWLDLVRYAETRAHEFDFPIPGAFQYRDYVIRAFDADLPYDRFITELFAGDLVEEPRLDPTGTFDESVLGTGAWFLGEEVHSPVEPRGDQADRIAHQVEVLSRSVLALGVACARCHDHKFDPISAEDYHGLSGFALSTAARQLRFETDGHNRALSARLQDFLLSVQDEATSAAAQALREEAEGLEEILQRALDAAEATRATTVESRTSEEDIAELDRLAAAAGLGWRVPILIEDFEATTLAESPLAPWTRTGDAFLDRPVRAEDTARQPNLVPRGQGSLNSYAGHRNAEGQLAPSDSFVGTLTSAPFPVGRRYLHLLINGGDGPKVRVEIIDAETDTILATRRGPRFDGYKANAIDLEAHQERRVRLRLIDEESGGWGQIGVDHLVLADSPDASALETARDVTSWRSLLTLEGEIDVERLMHWIELLNRPAGDDSSALIAWLKAPPPRRSGASPEDLGAEASANASPSRAVAGRVLVRYGALAGPRWIVNGPGFGTAPWKAGSVLLDADDPAKITSISAFDAAVAHPMWKDLAVRSGTATSRGGSFNWVQAGRTLLSPTFVSEHGRLAHLVRGRAKAFQIIAGHRMISGPLHQESIRTIDTRGQWRWVEQSTPTSAGLRSHMEFTALGADTFEVAMTVDLAPGDALPDPPASAAWLAERVAEGELSLEEVSQEAVSQAAVADRARWFQSMVLDAADLVELGGLAGRTTSDEERVALLTLADALVREHGGIKGAVAARLEGAAQTLREIRAERALVSSLAPAAIDLEGVDERVLDRGSWRAPGAAAPRRAPSALRASQEPLAANGEGSGRLALARSLLASPTGIVQRVWVNRLWQAMFSVGLVTTPDDFGAMGARPSHPEILDQLSLDFERDGWSTKRLLRRLALSDAYARSTDPTPSCAEKDPQNVWLSRSHVRRLEAEEIRDGLLAASGELDPKRFGPSVPIHLTSFMTGRGRPGRSGPLDGAGRRSIYLEVRRNFPHPFLSVFDWPQPSTCRGKRSSSNVPAQALTLLNDPFVEDRALHLAKELIAMDAPLGERLESLWLRTLGRLPTEKERELSAGFWLAAEESEKPGEAVDEVSAWTDLAHVLFNVKDFLFLQ